MNWVLYFFGIRLHCMAASSIDLFVDFYRDILHMVRGCFLGENIYSVERMTRDQLPESLSSIVRNKFSFFSDSRPRLWHISLHAKRKLTMEWLCSRETQGHQNIAVLFILSIVDRCALFRRFNIGTFGQTINTRPIKILWSFCSKYKSPCS